MCTTRENRLFIKPFNTAIPITHISLLSILPSATPLVAIRSHFGPLWPTRNNILIPPDCQTISMSVDRLNYWMCGLQPVWFHVVNVLLHVLSCLLFTRAALTVLHLDTRFATVAGLLFASHPVHTEAVRKLLILQI